MLPLGLGRNSAGLLRALRTPIPRSPGLPDAAGSGVLSGWRNLRRKPCRIRLCRRFSLRASGMPSCAFLRRSARGANPDASLRGKVGALRRSLLRQMPGALPGRTARAKAWPARRPPSEHCRRQGLRVLLAVLAVRGFLRTGGRPPAGEGSGFPGDVPATSWASPFCRGKLPAFSCVSGRMAETHAAGKALTPARSRKRAECGRPGLPHSG